MRTAVLRRVQVLDVRSPIALRHEAKVGEAGTSGDSSEPEPMRLYTAIVVRLVTRVDMLPGSSAQAGGEYHVDTAAGLVIIVGTIV